MGEPRVSITGEVREETETAWLFSDGISEAWLPKTRCQWNAENQEMEMPQWMALASKFI